VRRTDLNKVLDHVRRAVAEGGRISVDQAQRATLARICNRLDVGEMLESHFLFDPTTFPWRDRFGQLAAQEGLDSAIPVSALLAWTDEPRPRGLDPLVRNLLVAAYALITDRAWFHHGTPVPMPPLEQIRGEHELREPRLPDGEDWRHAVPRAARLFGVHCPELRSATNLSTLSTQVRARASALAPAARDLVGLLDSHASDLGLDTHDSTSRLATARSAANLVERLTREDDDVALVTVLARVGLPVADEVVAKSLSSAADVARAINATQWEIVRRLATLEPSKSDARAVLEDLHSTAAFEEHAKPLAPVLLSTVKTAVQIITSSSDAELKPPTSHRKTVPAAEIATVIDELETFAREHPADRITITWDLEP
jgi:hypothetical protein